MSIFAPEWPLCFCKAHVILFVVTEIEAKYNRGFSFMTGHHENKSESEKILCMRKRCNDIVVKESPPKLF